MVTHDNDRGLKCDLCPYRATFAAQLLKHITNAHADSPYNFATIPTTSRSNEWRGFVHLTGSKRGSHCFLVWQTLYSDAVWVVVFTSWILCESQSKIVVWVIALLQATDAPSCINPWVANVTTADGKTLQVEPPLSQLLPEARLALGNVRPSTVSRPLQCSTCGKMFEGRNKKQNLKHHYMVHTGERRYTCPFCGHRTAHKWHLKTHVMRRHPDRIMDSAVAWLGFKTYAISSDSQEVVNNDQTQSENFANSSPNVSTKMELPDENSLVDRKWWLDLSIWNFCPCDTSLVKNLLSYCLGWLSIQNDRIFLLSFDSRTMTVLCFRIFTENQLCFKLGGPMCSVK